MASEPNNNKHQEIKSKPTNTESITGSSLTAGVWQAIWLAACHQTTSHNPPTPAHPSSSSLFFFFLSLLSFSLRSLLQTLSWQRPGCCGETGAQDAVRSGDAGRVMSPAGGLLTGCAFITIWRSSAPTIIIEILTPFGLFSFFWPATFLVCLCAVSVCVCPNLCRDPLEGEDLNSNFPFEATATMTHTHTPVNHTAVGCGATHLFPDLSPET